MSTQPAPGQDEPVDPALAEAVESAFDGVVLDESGAVEAAPAGGDDGAPTDPLAEAQAEAARLTDDLARARADLYNLQQEYQGFVRRSREAAAGHRETGRASVVEALIPVLDEIALADQHGDLTGPFATTAAKLESILGEKFGLVRFGEAGDVFDPTLHEALMATESEEVDEPTIALVLQPGYRLDAGGAHD
uniref:nucleotide exchange factor GrpE n=1 Tax=Actinomyces sp. 217892 TaxID=2927827 RepID=UPI00202EF996